MLIKFKSINQIDNQCTFAYILTVVIKRYNSACRISIHIFNNRYVKKKKTQMNVEKLFLIIKSEECHNCGIL